MTKYFFFINNSIKLLPINPNPPVTIIFFIDYFIFTLVKSISIVDYTDHMSISRQNLTVIIVSFMSEKVIHDCISSIPKDIQILVVDNSNNKSFKNEIEKKRGGVFFNLLKPEINQDTTNPFKAKNGKSKTLPNP